MIQFTKSLNSFKSTKLSATLLFLVCTTIATQVYAQSDAINKLKKQISTDYNLNNYQQIFEASFQLIDQCIQEKNQKELAYAYENLGIFYSDIADYEASSSYYFKALKIATTLKNDKLYHGISLNIGTTLMETKNYKESKKYFHKAITFYSQPEHYSPNHLIAAYTNLSVAMQRLGDLNAALQTNKNAFFLAEELHSLDENCGLFINMGDIYLELGAFQKAQSNYEDALFYFKKLKDKKGEQQAKMGLSAILIHQSKFEEAIDTLKNQLDYFNKINDYIDLISCYNLLSDIHFKKQEFDKAYHYKTLELDINTLLNQKSKSQSISNLELRNSALEAQHKLKLNQKIVEKEGRILMLVITVSILLVICLITLIQVYRKRQKLIEKEKDLNLLKSEKEKIEIQQQLNYTERDLETFGLHLSQKNELLKKLKKELSDLKKVNAKNMVKELNQIIIQLGSSIKDDNELNHFIEKVEQVNSKFYSLLQTKHPDLTKNELRLCGLIKLNLSSKDIAVLSNVTTGAITMARYRLRLKIKLNPEIKLSEYLQQTN